ncbi:MAG TPA: hypothetical protein PLW02_10160, partial [Verrucomicrobiota bacterium]|nr:hypothetical protein [Verrucomicrobiota bacterium]
GKIGGRSLVGKYDPDGMFRPFGIAVDKQNRLWVAKFDISPRRISVWDTASGKFLKEYCGSTYYAAEGTRVNPLNPKEAFVLGNSCELDWKKGLWRVVGTPWRPTKLVDIPFVNAGSYNVVKYKGREFLIYNNGFLFCVMERSKKGDKPLAALGSIYGLFRNGEEWPDMILKKLTANPKQLEDLKKRYPKAFNGMGPSYPEVAFMLGSSGVKANFVWIDQNGDGLVQEEELQLFSNQDVGIKNQRGIFHTGGWGYAYGPDLSLYFPMADQQDGVPTIKVFHLVIREWNKAGAPVYDFQNMKVVGQEAVLGFGDSFQWVDSQSNVLVGHNPMVMISSDGKTLWQYPNPWPGVHGSHTAPAAKRGRIIGPLYVLGSAQVSRDVGEVFCLAGNLGERYLMTTDGLFLANLFADCRSAPDALPDEPRRGMSINSSTAGGESFGGEFFRNPSNGKYYLGGPVGACREASIIAELTGLDSARRLPAQSLKFTEQQHTEALQFQAQQAIKQAASKVLYITQVKQAVKEIPDWGAFDLNDRRVARWNFDPRHSASATWSYDENNLYIAFQSVRDDTPMINGGVDVFTLFKTGDAVEFELRSQPDKDDAKIIEGDLRIVISVFQGKPVDVLYNYKVPGTTEPVPFSSPVGTVKIDKVVVLDRAKIAIDRGNGEYSVRASIPL